MTDNTELLELIAELNTSEDKSRKALAAEIKRLAFEPLTAQVAEIERLRKLLEGVSKRIPQTFQYLTKYKHKLERESTIPHVDETNVENLIIHLDDLLDTIRTELNKV